MALAQDLVLDPSIRNWILNPITVTMVLVGLLRHYVTLLLNSSPKKVELKAIREQRGLLRGQILRFNANYITRAAFDERRAHLEAAYESGAFLKEEPGKAEQPILSGPMGDPNQMDAMMDGMKKQMVMMIPQTILMYWVQAFFSGAVTIKLPFPLTLRFKSMLQRGIDTTDMDVTWVSSLSWYFLNLFGLNAVYQLILGGEMAGSMSDMAMGGMAMQSTAPTMPGQQQDWTKIFRAERENLSLVEHVCILDDVEARLLRQYDFAV